MINNKSKKHTLIFGIGICIVHVIFFLLALKFKRIYNGDSFEYIYEAINIKDHFWFYSGNPALPVSEEYMTLRTPLYPFFLLSVYTFTINNWVVIVLQHILSIFNVLLLRKLLIKLGFDTRYDWFLFLFIIAFPAQFVHASIIEPELLLQTFVLLYVVHFLYFIKDPKPGYLLLMSLWLILGLFTKPVLYPFTAIHFCIVLYTVFRRRQPVVKSVIAAILPICTIFIYNAWNAERTGKFHFTSNQSFNAIYYMYYFKMAKERGPVAQEFLQTERNKIAFMSAFKDRYDYANDRGKTLLLQNFKSYTSFHLVRSLRFFVDPGKGDMDLFTGRLTYGRLFDSDRAEFSEPVKKYGFLKGAEMIIKDQPSIVLIFIIFCFNILKITGLMIFAFYKRIPLPIRMFILLFFAYFALLTGPITNVRYVLPVSLLIAGFAAMGFQKLRESSKKRVITTSLH